MKKSIAFLSALLFGSVTFAQVTKNENTNKSPSRKVSAQDIKKFPKDAETKATSDVIKGKPSEKRTIKATVAREKGRESILQKGKGKVTTTEKKHYTVKLASGKQAKGTKE